MSHRFQVIEDYRSHFRFRSGENLSFTHLFGDKSLNSRTQNLVSEN